MKLIFFLVLVVISSTVLAEPKYGVFDVSNNIGTISSKASILHGVYINTTLSAHTIIIKNATTSVFTIPASATAGNYYNFNEIEFSTNLIIDPDDSATGNITVIYDDLVRGR